MDGVTGFDFPGLDPTLPMPGERSCCTLFPGGGFSFFRTSYLGPDQIGQHRYGAVWSIAG